MSASPFDQEDDATDPLSGADIQDGEFVDLPANDDDVEDTPDGGAMVKIDTTPKRGESSFYVNLADELDESFLDATATKLLDLITRDKDARSKRDEQYADGIRRTGLGNDAPGGATFEGASKVVHPVLTEVCIDFAARAIKEVFPPDGPAKSKIVGDVTKERVAKASRKADFMNWQLTIESQEFRSELEQMLTQLPLGGSQYMKANWLENRNRPVFEFLPIDDVYVPFAATNFLTAQRKTHAQKITQLTYEQRVASEMYRDIDLAATVMLPDQTRAARANDKVEGRDDSAYNEDGLREVFEVYVTWETPDDPENDGEPAPYIISIDSSSRRVLSFYRNWDEQDRSREELEWIVEFTFVPWRGAYGIGIGHIAGGLSAAATGALRALLDSAHIQNSASMIKLKGGTRGGQSLEIQPTQVLEVEGGINVDDIRKLAMPLPFNPPSPTLFSLLGFIVDAAKGVVRTTLDDISDSTENTPVGTTMARIEQGMVVYSAIHARLHAAMFRLLGVQHRLNAMYLDDRDEEDDAGSLIASRADFNGPMDVVPVSDPNIFSEAQRYAQVQAVAQRAALNPDLYNRREVESRILYTLKVPDPDSLLAPKTTPTEENAVAENVKASLGRPVVAFPQQDHIAHLKAHLAYMQSPVLGSSQLIAPKLLPVMLGHIAEHVALWYAVEVNRTADDAVHGDFSQMLIETRNADDKRSLDRLVAEASLDVVGAAQEVFAKLPPEIAKAAQLLQQVAPKPPADPAVQVAREDVQMRGEVAKGKNQIDQQKLQVQAQGDQAEGEREQQREAADTQRTHLEIASREQQNEEDNATDLQIALLHDRADQRLATPQEA